MSIHHSTSRAAAIPVAAGKAILLFSLVQPFSALAAGGHGESGGDLPWIDFSMYGFEGLWKLFNVHPAFVHFPIALFPMVLLFYCLGVWMKKPALLLAGRVTLYTAFVALLIAVYTGLNAQGGFPHNEHIHQMTETHKHTGYVILALATVLLGWSFWTASARHAEEGAAKASHLPRASWAFLLTAAVTVYFIMQTGDIGSRMVYLQGAAVKPMAPILKAQSGYKSGGHEEGGDQGEGSAGHHEEGKPAGTTSTGASEMPESSASPSPKAGDGHDHTH